MVWSRITNTSLFKQGLLCVGVILFFEISILSALVILLNRAESEAASADRSRQIVLLVGSVGRIVATSAISLTAFAATSDQHFIDQFEQARGLLPTTVAKLDQLTDAEPEDKAIFKELWNHSKTMLDTAATCLSILKNPSVNGIGKFASLNTLMRNHVYRELQAVFSTSNKLVERHERNPAGNLELLAKQYLKQAIYAGIFFNLLIATVLIAIFSRRITSRLSILTRNVRLLSNKQALLPALSGSDEIGVLDRSFHEMATALRQAASKDRASFINMPVGLLICDVAGTIEDINPRGQQLLGCSQLPERHSLFDLSTTLGERLHEVKSEGQLHQELQVKRLDASTFPAEVSITQFEHEEGLKYLVSLNDVSERKELEQLKQEFVAIVSHDLRNPLTSIQSYIKLVEVGAYGSLNERGNSATKLAQKECERLIRLTNDLLEVAKLESGSIDLDLQEHRVSTIVEHIVDSMAPQFDARNISIKQSMQPVICRCDADKISQVLTNLLSNAIKFSASGSCIKIDVVAKEKSAQVQIVDEGRGIPESQINTIFDRFKQVQSRDSKTGTGLGLAICKMIVESHGGQIGVTSRENAGSTFWFTLPLAAERVAPQA